ncbi:hypothetical protein ATCC90586_005421 [Pythium insidiosum]|nr:hypothetical protein ATCC90586_005421 [Pythium insidiosum]
MASTLPFDALRRRCLARQEPLWRAVGDQRFRFDGAAELQVELLRWWSDTLQLDDDSDGSDDDSDGHKAAGRRLSPEQHGRLFRGLVFALQQLEHRQSSSSSGGDTTDPIPGAFSALKGSDLEELSREDWASSSSFGDGLTRDRLMAAVGAVAQACVGERVAAEQPQAVLDALKALHELTFAQFPDDQFQATAAPRPTNHMQQRRSASSLQQATRRIMALKRTKSTIDGSLPLEVEVPEPKPQTLAEKLVRMRTQRSLLPITSPPAADVNASPSSLQSSATPSSPSTSSLVLSSGSPSTAHRSSSSAATPQTTDSLHDDASHYFAIETRIELKERLKALQRQLQELLLQSKLAWMRCFAASDGDPAPSAAIDDATRLVTIGESLALHLQGAFLKARTHSCPIDEYSSTVETAERQFAEYQTLVRQLVTAPSSPARRPRDDVTRHEPAIADSELSRPGRLQTLTADLPSMKSYIAKVAPPYSAYLEPLQKTRGLLHRTTK